ncbi:MAG: hypothetical protein ACMVO5_05915 [Polymorphobacter sp.]|uniref:hypothetical protein n=1 Tax=Polymorphobacter sp. TaxID=1909290 RepID=UPI003A8B1DB4
MAGSLARTLVATRPLRLPVDPTDPNTAIIDETDFGGNRQIRIALSETVYATDSGLTLAALAGWRTGEAAANGVVVTNNSNIEAPKPVMRWVVQPWQLDTTPIFRLSLLVFGHHPVGFLPVAGVKFTVTDGVDTITAWATGLGTCPYGEDGLRCHTVEIDASGLIPGLLRADAEVYPWLGAMRSTDPAGTRVMTDIWTSETQLNVGTENPLVLANDPDGTFYRDQWVMTDPVSGSTTASAAMVATTLAGARLVATKPLDMRTAMQALYLNNKTTPAANGYPIQTRMVGGATIVIPAGVTIPGTITVTAGNFGGLPIEIIGDPDDPNPRENCILRGDTQFIQRAFRVFVRNLKIEVGGTAIFADASNSGIYFRNLTLALRPAGGAANLTQSQSTRGWQYSVVNCRWTVSGLNMDGTNHRFGLIRNVEHNDEARGLALVKNKWVGDPFSTFDAVVAGSWNNATFPEGYEDNILAYGDYRGTRNRIYNMNGLSGVGTPNNAFQRYAIVGNVFERVGSNPGPFLAIGEGQDGTFRYNIIESNTFAGERCNFIYNDPFNATLEDTNTKTNYAYANRVANNAFDWNANKQDSFNSPAALSIRTAAGVPNPTGYRPHLVEGWSDYMGVGREGNYDSATSPGFTSSFPYWFHGLRSEQASPATQAGYVDNASHSGTGLALGDYTPVAGSPLLGRMLRGQSDVDHAGSTRQLGGAAGAFELPGPAGEVALAPEDARHDQLSSSPDFGGAVSLAPASAFHGYGGLDPLVAVLMGLVPAQGWLMVSAADAAVGVRLALVPATSGPVMLATSPLLSFGGLTLAAANGRLLLSGEAASLEAVLTEAGVPAVRLLRVGAEQRVFFAPLG